MGRKKLADPAFSTPAVKVKARSLTEVLRERSRSERSCAKGSFVEYFKNDSEDEEVGNKTEMKRAKKSAIKGSPETLSKDGKGKATVEQSFGSSDESCIKVAHDFVSPEKSGQCIDLSNEFCLLPEGHRAKEDTLEVKKMAICALMKAINDIENKTSDVQYEKKATDDAAENSGQCIELSNEFRLLTEGHRAKEHQLEVKKMAICALRKAIGDIQGKKYDVQNEKKATDDAAGKRPNGQRKSTKQRGSEDKGRASDEEDQAECPKENNMSSENKDKLITEDMAVDGKDKTDEAATDNVDKHREDVPNKGLSCQEQNEATKNIEGCRRSKKGNEDADAETDQKLIEEPAKKKRGRPPKVRFEKNLASEKEEKGSGGNSEDQKKLADKSMENDSYKADKNYRSGRSKKGNEDATDQKLMEKPVEKKRGRPPKVKIEKSLASEKEENGTAGSLKDQKNLADKTMDNGSNKTDENYRPGRSKKGNEDADDGANKKLIEEPVKKKRGRSLKVRFEENLASEKEEKGTGGNSEDQKSIADITMENDSYKTDENYRSGRSKKGNENADAETDQKLIEDPVKKKCGRPPKVRIEINLALEKEEKDTGGNSEDQKNLADKTIRNDSNKGDENYRSGRSQKGNEDADAETDQNLIEEPVKKKRGR